MGLVAYGTGSGHIKLLSLGGYEQELYGYHDNVPIEFLLFAPGQHLLFSIDA